MDQEQILAQVGFWQERAAVALFAIICGFFLLLVSAATSLGGFVQWLMILVIILSCYNRRNAKNELKKLERLIAQEKED